MDLYWQSNVAAASAAKSLQSCPTLCDPIDGSPAGSAVPGLSRQEYWSGLPLPSLNVILSSHELVAQYGLSLHFPND